MKYPNMDAWHQIGLHGVLVKFSFSDCMASSIVLMHVAHRCVTVSIGIRALYYGFAPLDRVVWNLGMLKVIGTLDFGNHTN